MATKSKTVKPTVADTKKGTALADPKICRKCGVTITDANLGSTSREGKMTCTNCLKGNAAVTTIEVAEPAPKLTDKTVEQTAGMVPLSEQLTDEEKQKGKVIVTEQNEDGTVAAITIIPPAPVKPAGETGTLNADERQLWAKAFIAETVMSAIANGTGSTDFGGNPALHAAVLTELSKLLPQPMDAEKRAKQLETLERARRIRAERLAAQKSGTK